MAQQATGKLNISVNQACAAAQGTPRDTEAGVKVGHMTDNATHYRGMLVHTSFLIAGEPKANRALTIQIPRGYKVLCHL